VDEIRNLLQQISSGCCVCQILLQEAQLMLTKPLKGFPVEFRIDAGVKETRVMRLSEGRKSFQIALAVLIQYRSVTARHPASQPATLP